MVTVAARRLNDSNNNNNSNTYSTHDDNNNMSIDTDNEEDNNNNNNNDSSSKYDEEDTDDENIDVSVDSDIEDDRSVSGDPGSMPASMDGRSLLPHIIINNRYHHHDPSTARRSPHPPHRLPLPLPHPPRLPLHQPPSIMHLHRSSPNFHPTTTTPPPPTTTTTTTTTAAAVVQDGRDRSSPSSPSKENSPSYPRTICKLSFGIDRILSENKKEDRKRVTIKSQDSPRREEEEEEEEDYLNDDDHDDDDGDDKLRQHSSIHPRPRLHSPSEPSTRLTPVVSCCPPPPGPPRVLPPMDIVSPLSLSPFHGALLPPADLCRSEPPTSLDVLPIRPVWPDVYVCPWTGVQRDRFGLVRRVGHPYQNRTPPKRKKPRTAFSRQQVLELEKRFTRQKYLASAERSALAKTLSMTDAQVKTWFQNRRTKWRRQTAEEREIERQAAHKFLLSLRPEDPNRPSVAYGALCGVTQAGPHPASDTPHSPGAPAGK